MPATRVALAARLRQQIPVGLPAAVLGFDGFVDEMIRVVAERLSPSTYHAVPSIALFGDQILRAAGHSSLREIVVTATHPGGCAVNMGDGLAALGAPVDLFATLGEPPHPAFAAVTQRFRRVESWGREPGRTLAYEFDDGKLMFSAVAPLAEFAPESVARHLANGTYATACATARVIALTDWTLYPHMTAVWRLLAREVFRQLRHRPAFFLDLVDPSGRSPEDIRAMLAVLPEFEASGPVTLGLNGNEANILARLLDLPVCNPAQRASTAALASALRRHLQISEVVIHHIKSAACANARGAETLAGPFCAQPKKSTGAGDRFNAGYALGLMLALSPAERLLCACACSGFFVREARSATLTELADFLAGSDWPDSALR